MAPENLLLEGLVEEERALQWGRGRMAPENRLRRLRQEATIASFNGAGAGWPRKTAIAAGCTCPVMELQWGRGRMAPENNYS